MPEVAGIGAIVHNFISVGGRQLRKPLFQRLAGLWENGIRTGINLRATEF